MLRVSLKQIFNRGNENNDDNSLFNSPFMTLRPEQLTIAQFVELTNLVGKELCADTVD
jgi:16S rRNA (adenine1518-N6/adenine1519-N6)-dimethyltransferase